MKGYTTRLEDFVTKLETRSELEVAIQMTTLLEDMVIDETSKTMLSLINVILDNEKALRIRHEIIDNRNETINDLADQLCEATTNEDGVELTDIIESLEEEVKQLEDTISDLELEISSIDENAYEVEIARLSAQLIEYEDKIERLELDYEK